MNNDKYYIGQNINGAILLEKLLPLPGKDQHPRWRVRQVDGEERIVREGYLYKSKAIRRDKIDSNAALNQVFKTYISGAKRRNIIWELSKEQFVIITSDNCFYCGCTPHQKAWKPYEKSKDYIYNGIDRLDNTKGYTFNNVCACCVRCNYMKRILSVSDFLTHVTKVYKNKNSNHSWPYRLFHFFLDKILHIC